jgi:anti-sigma-K factor RskA
MSEPGPHREDDVTAYALGALEPAEAEAFRAHLETCASCRQELAAFQQVVDTLPLSAPAHRAPAGLRRRVLAEVGVGPTPAPPSRWRAIAGGWMRPALAAAAVLAVVAVVALRLGLGSAPPYREYQAHVTGQGVASLGVHSGHGNLVLTDFAPPPPGDIYEVWVKRGNRAPQPTTALFGVTKAGSANVAVPAKLSHGTTVMVTPEPQGGSRVPTHPPVLVVSI